jgi:hypothetical protein
MNKLVIRQVNGQAMLQEVCLGYTAPGHLSTLGVIRQRLATMAEVMMFACGYGALLRYELLPLSDRLAARCLR